MLFASKLLSLNAYRPPNSQIEFLDKIEVLFQNLDKEHKELIIVGDLNCDFLSNNISNHTKRFNDIVNIFQLTQLIDQPTRITEKTASLLDVALVNNPENISHSEVLHVGISDHSLIYVCRKISFVKNYPKFVESIHFKNYIQRDFNQDLYHALFNLNWEINYPNMLWDLIMLLTFMPHFKAVKLETERHRG